MNEPQQDNVLVDLVAAYLASHCHDPRHPRTKEWHARAHLRHAKDIVNLIERNGGV